MLTELQIEFISDCIKSFDIEKALQETNSICLFDDYVFEYEHIVEIQHGDHKYHFTNGVYDKTWFVN